MAAILNFSETLKKSPAHLHIKGDVIAKFDKFLTLSFRTFTPAKRLNWPQAAILNFGSILKKSLAHPHIAKYVMLKLKKNWPN